MGLLALALPAPLLEPLAVPPVLRPRAVLPPALLLLPAPVASA